MPWWKWINLVCIVVLSSVIGYKVLSHQHISIPHLIFSAVFILGNIVGLFSKESPFGSEKKEA
ncbi:hypothetical protein JD965_00100 [Bacillus siamensis]|uniref:hypothetical protein n=1 Tax=Bacillus siamensis TaxID=659243 RepID=UPI000647BCF1|nr:hypothetical protein [Bacillus siamensis]QQD82125.1 hypothetical protein JD965_00100 [Bacillus siamensis]